MQSSTKRKVLVIDDDTLIRRTICMALQKLDYEILEAPTGNAGLQEFRKFNPDVVLTDVVMPDKNGLEAIAEMRAAQPGVRIIAMSGGGTVNKGDALQMALDVGAAAVLSKPFGVPELVKAIEDVTSQKKT